MQPQTHCLYLQIGHSVVLAAVSLFVQTTVQSQRKGVVAAMAAPAWVALMVF